MSLTAVSSLTGEKVKRENAVNHLFCSLIYKVGPSTDESFGT